MSIRQRLALILLAALGVADGRMRAAPACTPYSRIAGFCEDAHLTGAAEGDTMSLDARATTVTFDWLLQARLPPASYNRSHTGPRPSRGTLLRACRWPVAPHALTSRLCMRVYRSIALYRPTPRRPSAASAIWTECPCPTARCRTAPLAYYRACTPSPPRTSTLSPSRCVGHESRVSLHHRPPTATS
jgi:hypothetical protein